MKIFTLFYFSDGDKSINLGEARDDARFEIYVRNAILLSKSLGADSELIVISNHKDRYEEILEKYSAASSNIDVRQIDFHLDVPNGINFYSAHFKIDLLKHLASIGEDCFPCMLVDSDVVFLGSDETVHPTEFTSNHIGAYDISTQVFPAYGKKVVQADIATLAPQLSGNRELKWYGGEYIYLPSKAATTELVKIIDLVWLRYKTYSRDLHHQGDEAVVSTALNILRSNGMTIADMGGRSVIRYWSGPTKHKQYEWSIMRGFNGFLHLPQDKRMLSTYLIIFNTFKFRPKLFLMCYFIYCQMKLIATSARNILRQNSS